MNDYVGMTKQNNAGQKMQILGYKSDTDIDVLFEDGTIVCHRSLKEFEKGRIRNPNQKLVVTAHSDYDKYMGMTNTNKQGYIMTVIAYRKFNDVDIKFEDGTILRNRNMRGFLNGSIMKPLTPEEMKSKSEKTTPVGQINRNKAGELMKIITFRNSADIDVQFEDGAVAYHKTFYNFRIGNIGNPNTSKHARTRTTNSICLGRTGTNKLGQKMTIIGYRSTLDIDVQFDDGSIVYGCNMPAFQNKTLRSPKSYIGMTGVNNCGQSMKIIACRNGLDIDVQFEDGAVVTGQNMANFRRGLVNNPNHFIGMTNINNKGYKMTIIAYRGLRDIDVQFEDGSIVRNRRLQTFKEGLIAKPKNLIGTKGKNRAGQVMTIVAYRGIMDLDVQFEDGAVSRGQSMKDFKAGYIKHPDYYIGLKKMNKTRRIMTLIAYHSHSDVDVRFEDGTIVENQTFLDFKEGRVINPNYKLEKKDGYTTFEEYRVRHPFSLESQAAKVGETTFINGQRATIVRYVSDTNVDVLFDDGTVVEKKLYAHFLHGKLKNLNPDKTKKPHIGEIKRSVDLQFMQIIGYQDENHITVMFNGSAIVENKTYADFTTGNIKNPLQPKPVIK